ncbi:PAS domain S-box protein [Geomonas sp.]|uniref:hybrid sensor histidine kinase/response regulator n=1 Tax=Geomonas sp. TaxID=2651584 RepID=UPI002B499E3F|nr:PAS domain S-box protein [Geomonas sp.]HJV34797.1 PAS domain S-box protein [Geomonas sp.]
MKSRLKLGGSRETSKIVGIYVVFGSAWIYLSDTILTWFVRDPETISHISVFKGLVFIVITSTLLYQLIARFVRRDNDAIAQLVESEERFQAIYDNVNDALFIHDPVSGHIMDVNRTMSAMFGYSRQEAIHLRVQELSLGEPPYSQEEALALIRQTAQGIPQISEWRSRKKDGTIFWSEVNMRGATINGQERIIVMVRDIEARKMAEEALRQNEELLKVLMEEMPVGIGWTDESGAVQYLNRCLIDWLGYTIDDLPTIDRWLLSTLPDPEYRAKIKEAWSRAMAATRTPGAVVSPFEARLTCSDGSVRHVILNLRLVHNRIVYIFTDVTRWQSMQSELLKTQKLESLAILAGGIAHDFNNILTGILGNISFLGLLLDGSHPARKPLENAEKASLRAAELAHQLLTFAKGGQPVMKPVSVADLVQESLNLALRGSKVTTTVDIAASLDGILADEGQMSQVFNNVIINALQAMPEGGALGVRGENVILDADNSAALPAGCYVRVSFTDQGCGITMEDQQKIFDPYFTTKAGGTGLGLASVHSIVAKHQGKIEVDSTLGHGTTFTFYLPSAGELVATPPPASQPPALEAVSKGAILVMDDEEPIRTLTTGILEFLGYSVTTCSTGEEAVSLYREARETGEPFFAVIMDLTVPTGMGGKDAARHILALDPAARLIVSSGYSNDPVMARFAEHGFCAAIIKPYRSTEIQQALSEVGKTTALTQ